MCDSKRRGPSTRRELARSTRDSHPRAQLQTFASTNGPADWSSCFRPPSPSPSPCDALACARIIAGSRTRHTQGQLRDHRRSRGDLQPAKRELANFSSRTLLEPAGHLPSLPPLASSSRPLLRLPPHPASTLSAAAAPIALTQHSQCRAAGSSPTYPRACSECEM